jgi:HD domain
VPDRGRHLPAGRTRRERSARIIETMSIPDRRAAAALLLELDPPPWALRHARAVAEVAGWLAARIARQGTPVDRRLVEAAALLHDVDKLLPAGHPLRALPHGDGSAAWLTAHGHPELGSAVAGHPVTRLADDRRYRSWAGSAGREERIVAYADKRASQRLGPMDARFAGWARRYGPGSDPATARRVRARAARLEAEVCRTAGVRPDEVGRLRWTGPALAAARRLRAGHAPIRRVAAR